ncbi:cyclic nucleotide-binding domain-containing protein 2 isoform X2 [Microcaecilia unicolor]|uniref:Cyclic nucleotide-binding domain-containing protein 2 n=1 Tax=Microcaecilia unicolor TaxID=1415580 RepID=A0A6P7X6H3_9AMPH|nr:cyclic nucleotide-binding domain-containing protein 2-like isoform X2 [Microcaecilia unicolor]
MRLNKHEKKQHDPHAVTYLQRFQDTVQKVMTLQAVTKYIIRITEDALGSKFWGDVSVPNARSHYNTKKPKESEQNSRKQDCAFDTNSFRSQYEFTFPEKAIEIASRKPEERSPEDVCFIRSVMRGILSFRHYSNAMQLMLARVIHYKRFGKRRVVVRKGHRGDSFYFVFSGVIAVTQDEDGTSALLDPEPILLRKGASFGEVALLKGLRRNATVVCMEETEFLVVDKDEFFKNKLDQELQKELVYRFSFFRSLDLFSSWSDEALEKLAQHCKTEECHHSRVIVNDTSETKNIIFITKGRCDILRLVDLSQCPSYLKWIKRQEALLGKVMVSSQPERRTDTRKKPGSKFKASVAETEDTHNSLLSSLDRRSTLQAPQTSEGFSNLGSPKISSSNPRVTHSTTRSDSKTESNTRKYKDSFFTLEELVREKWRARVNPKIHLGETLPSHLVASVYLRIDALRPGQYFSLSCLSMPVHRDPRAMVIVSRGSEVIRIKLDKFCELADLPTTRKLKEETQYPSDNELCHIFLEQNRWKIFKHDLVRDLQQMSDSLQILNPRACLQQQHRNEWDFESQGVLHLGPVGKDRRKVFWVTPVIPNHSASGNRTLEMLPPVQKPIRLIHGIDIPKVCGKRLMC